MNKKIICIGIIGMFLLTSFSSLSIAKTKEYGKIIIVNNSGDYNSVLKSVEYDPNPPIVEDEIIFRITVEVEGDHPDPDKEISANLVVDNTVSGYNTIKYSLTNKVIEISYMPLDKLEHYYEIWIYSIDYYDQEETHADNTWEKTITAGDPYYRTLYVDDDNQEGPWDGSEQNPYKHIQNAVDHAYRRDTIKVKSGIYEVGLWSDINKIYIGKSLDLISENKETTMIKGDGCVERAIVLSGKNILLKGFTISNTGECGLMIASSSSDNTIENNIFTGCKPAIYLGGDNNKIFENIFDGNSLPCGAVSGIIRLFGNGNEIYKNNFNDESCEISTYWRCKNNKIYQNNFIAGKDINCAEDPNYIGVNLWYNPELKKGNYWDDYLGVGPYVKGGIYDKYPLKKPYGENSKVDKNINFILNIFKDRPVIFKIIHRLLKF